MSILLVDAIPTALDTQQQYLKSFEFYRVWTAKKAEEALDVLRERPIDLMITAVKLQPISGMQLVEMTRREPGRAGLPIILVADHVDKVLEKKASELKVDSVVAQPIKAKNFCEAVEKALEPFIDSQEEEFLTHFNAGRQAERDKKRQAAEEAFRAALGVRWDEEAALGLAKALSDQEKEIEAARVYLDIIKKNPLCLQAYLALAHVYESRGRLEDALKVMAAAVNAAMKLKETNTVRASILFQMGQLELRLKNLKRALGFFDQACETTPDDTTLAVQVGDTLQEAGHAAESEKYYESALSLDPNLVHVYNRLGIAYRRQGKFDKALTLYQKAMNLSPEDENLYYNLARCLWDMENFETASKVLGKALELNPEFTAAAQLLDAVMRRINEQAAGGEASTAGEPHTQD